jgi:hypothetical protein
MEETMKIVEVKKVPRRIGDRRDWLKGSIVYVELQGETIRENLENRRCRPYTTYKKFLTPLFAELGIPLDAKLAWNQKAGCSCPCSPGFMVKRTDPYGSTYNDVLRDENGKLCNLYITISAE